MDSEFTTFTTDLVSYGCAICYEVPCECGNLEYDVLLSTELFFDHRGERLVSHLTPAKSCETGHINISEMIPTQEYVASSTVSFFSGLLGLTQSEGLGSAVEALPFVVNVGYGYLIRDGHHRLSSMALLNLSTALCYIEDLT